MKPYDNYLPRLGKKLTVAIGEPIDSSLLLKEIESEGTLSEDEKRSALTAKCRRLLEAVQQQAEQSHFN